MSRADQACLRARAENRGTMPPPEWIDKAVADLLPGAVVIEGEVRLGRAAIHIPREAVKTHAQWFDWIHDTCCVLAAGTDTPMEEPDDRSAAA